MERFATNKNGNIDSGTEVLSNNMVFLQQAKANAISNLFGDLFVEGILNTGNVDTMFKVSANNDGTFNVGKGFAYRQDINVTPSIYERIAIIDDNEEYNSANPTQVTPDGAGQYVLTPKSSGCKNIPIPNTNTEYYIDIRYLNVCDNGNTGDDLGLKNYSIAKNESLNINVKRKRFYKWIDGYQIVLVPKPQNCLGICVGTISKAINNEITITNENRSKNLLIQSRVIMDYFDAGQGITFIDVGNQKILGINVDNVTTEINEDNQLGVTKDGLYPYVKFSVNSGPAIFLTGTGNEISTLNSSVPLWLNPAYDYRYSIVNKGLSPINIWTIVQEDFNSNPGRYTVCINNTNRYDNTRLEEPKLELMGYVYVGKTAPIDSLINPDISELQPRLKNYDIWLDISTQPYKAKMYYNGNWVEYNGVPVGLVNWINTTVGIEYGSNLFQFDFNKDYTQWDTIGEEKINFSNANPDQSKYLVLDGSAKLKFLYNDLYRKIGDIYGTPDTLPNDAPSWATVNDYFLLPDLVGKVIWGGNDYNNIVYLEAGLPNITGDFGVKYQYGYPDGTRSTGAFQLGSKAGTGRVAGDSSGNYDFYYHTLNASRSSSIYKDNITTVQPPALQIPVLIKYTV